MSDTPRTDAVVMPANLSVTSDYCLLETLARELERENIKLRAAVRWWIKYPEFIYHPKHEPQVVADIEAARSLFTELETDGKR